MSIEEESRIAEEIKVVIRRQKKEDARRLLQQTRYRSAQTFFFWPTKEEWAE